MQYVVVALDGKGAIKRVYGANGLDRASAEAVQREKASRYKTQHFVVRSRVDVLLPGHTARQSEQKA